MIANRLSDRIKGISASDPIRANLDDIAPVRYVIFFTPRSGSSWLTDVLHQTGELGEPGEYFNPAFVENIAKSIQANEPLDYLKKIVRRKKSKNLVFGCELTYNHLNFIDGIDFLGEFRPHAVFYLRRRDIVAQAVSLYRATTTGFFHHITGSNKDVPASAVPYDGHRIQSWCDDILAQESELERFFEKRHLKPTRMFYEDLAGHPGKAISVVSAEVLGVDWNGQNEIVPAHRKIPGEISAKLAIDFKTEFSGYIDRLIVKREMLGNSEDS